MIYADNAATTKMSDAAIHTMVSLMNDTCLIMSGEDLFLCQGNEELKEIIEEGREGSYISGAYAVCVNGQKYSDAKTVYVRKSEGA